MRIVVNDIAASGGGAMSILEQFYRSVQNADGGHEWIFLLNDNYFEQTENVKIIVRDDVKKSRIKKLWFDFFGGKKFVKGLKPDVIVSLQNIITFGVKVPQVVYMHQSIPFQDQKNFSFFKRDERSLAVIQKLIGRVIKKSVKKADKVIVQSQWIRDAVIKKTKIKEDKIVAVMPTIEDFSELKVDGKWDKNSFFYPSSNYVYKNNQLVFDAVKQLREEGFSDVRFKTTLPSDAVPNCDGIVCTGQIDKKEVISEHNYSTLVFPSYIETVGLPMLEARQMGTVVLASDCPFSREVLQGYDNAYFFNPFSVCQLTDLMRKVITGEIERKPVNENNATIDSWQRIKDVIYATVSE